MTPSWEQLPRETGRSYSMFRAYRDMGDDRSYAKVAAEFKVSKRNVDKIASMWRWQERLREWAAHDRAAEEKALLQERIEAKRRHAAQARGLQSVAVRTITAYQNTLATKADAVLLTAAETHAWMKLGVDQERDALDLNTPTRLEVSGPGGIPFEPPGATPAPTLDLTRLSHEELLALKAMMEKAG